MGLTVEEWESHSFKEWEEISKKNREEWSELIKYLDTKHHYSYNKTLYQIEVYGDYAFCWDIRNPTIIEENKGLLIIDELDRIPNKVIFLCDGNICIRNLKCLKIPREVGFICTGTVTIEDLNIDTSEMSIKGINGVISGVKFLNYLIGKGFYE